MVQSTALWEKVTRPLEGTWWLSPANPQQKQGLAVLSASLQAKGRPRARKGRVVEVAMSQYKVDRAVAKETRATVGT